MARPDPLYVVPRHLPETRDERQDRHVAQRRAAERTAFVAMDECCWPGCEREPKRRPEPLPLCNAHAFRVHCALQDSVEDQPALTEHKLNREIERRRKQAEEAQAQESRSLTPGWVYYLRVDERIKIGYSTNVRQRMRAYPPHAELLAVHPGTPSLERDMHRRFAGHLAQGREWFRPDPPLMEHIDDVVAQFGPPPKKFIYRFREGTRQQIKVRRR